MKRTEEHHWSIGPLVHDVSHCLPVSGELDEVLLE